MGACFLLVFSLVSKGGVLKKVLILVTVVVSFFLYSPGVLAQSPLPSSCVVGDRGSFIVDFKSSLSPFVFVNGSGGGYWIWSSSIGGVAHFPYSGNGNQISNMKIPGVSVISSLNKVSDVYLDELDISYWVSPELANRGQVYIFLKNGNFYKKNSTGAGTNYADFRSMINSSPVDYIVFSSSDTRNGTYSQLMDNFQVNWTCKPHNRPSPTVTPTMIPIRTSTPAITLTITPTARPTSVISPGQCLISSLDRVTMWKDAVTVYMGTGTNITPVFTSPFVTSINTSFTRVYQLLFDVLPVVGSPFPVAIVQVEFFDGTNWVNFGSKSVNVLTGEIIGGLYLDTGSIFTDIRLTSIDAPVDGAVVSIDRIYVKGIDCTVPPIPTATPTPTLPLTPTVIYGPTITGTATPAQGSTPVLSGTVIPGLTPVISTTVIPGPGGSPTITGTIVPGTPLPGTPTPGTVVVTGTLEAPYTTGLCKKESFTSSDWSCSSTGWTFQWLGCTIGGYFAPIRYSYDMIRVPIAAGRYGTCQQSRLVNNSFARFTDIYSKTVYFQSTFESALIRQETLVGNCSIGVARGTTTVIGCSIPTYQCTVRNVISKSKYLFPAWNVFIGIIAFSIFVKALKMFVTGDFYSIAGQTRSVMGSIDWGGNGGNGSSGGGGNGSSGGGGNDSSGGVNLRKG